ncbi:helix-turn-helix domain-containing protein [Agromyces subbeticus]|uniref:helix-turn-helix domain-containing protein n=1 Tax=Agromyces subbeticus TaxID=293890 RepID=UPI00058B9FE2
MAIYLGASEHSVRLYASRGDIPAFKVGGRWRFYLSDVRAHLTRVTPAWHQSNQSRGRSRLS